MCGWCEHTNSPSYNHRKRVRKIFPNPLLFPISQTANSCPPSVGHFTCLSCAVGRPALTSLYNQHGQFGSSDCDSAQACSDTDVGVVVFLLELHIVQVGNII